MNVGQVGLPNGWRFGAGSKFARICRAGALVGNDRKVVLVTGVSSGFGQACAQYLAHRGCLVYGTSRREIANSAGCRRGNEERISPSVSEEETVDPVTVLTMDVRSSESVSSAVQEVLKREGRIDVLINNAGIGIAGSLEDTSIEEMKTQFDTNFFGAVRVCQAVLPSMRRAGCGLIVNISSMAGLFGIPFQGAYTASKFALEGFSESLRMEVRSFGLRVVLVAPGDFKTGFTENRRFVQGSESSDYQQQCARALEVMIKAEQAGSKPLVLAKLVDQIIKKRRPSLRYTAGRWYERLAVLLKRILPGSLFEKIIRGNYKL